MAGIRYQPQGLARLNRTSPLGRGLVSGLLLANTAFGDISDGGAWTPTGPVVLGGSPRGKGLKVKGATASYLSRPTPAALSSASQPMTMRYRLFLNSAATTAIMSWGTGAQDGAPRYYARIYAGTLSLYFSGSYHSGGPVVAGGEYIVTHVFDGAAYYVYVNGILLASGQGAWQGNAGSFYLGMGYDGVNASSDFLLSDFAAWNRALSAAEVASDTQNPWQVFADPYEDEEVVVVADTPASLVGGAAVQAAAAGTLSTSIPLSGGAGAQAVSAGALSTAVRMAGAAMALAAGAGVLTTAVQLSGAAIAQATGAGAFSTSVRLTGPAQAEVTAVGALNTAIKLAGAAQAQATGSATLSGSAASLNGAAAAQAAAAAALSTSTPLQGVAQASAFGSASLGGTSAPLAGGATAQAGGSGALSTVIALAGSAAGRATGYGMLTTSISLNGVASALASAIGMLVDGGSVSVPDGGIIEVVQISPERVAVFEGSGSRVAVFGGSGSRVAIFEGSGSRMRFDQMSAKVPVMVNGKMTTDRDPDEESFYAADITDELADRNTTPIDGDGAVEPILNGVALLQGPSLQVVNVDGVARTYVVVLLGGLGGDPPSVWNWIARVRCKNGERFDKTTWFNRVDT